MLRIASVHDLVVRHRNDHRQRFAFGNEIVGDVPITMHVFIIVMAFPRW
jgi:hypothetical protein